VRCWCAARPPQCPDARPERPDRLELDVVDLYLIHRPAPAQDRYVDTWRAFIELKAWAGARDRRLEPTARPARTARTSCPRWSAPGPRRRPADGELPAGTVVEIEAI
jgi:hypothetical protein